MLVTTTCIQYVYLRPKFHQFNIQTPGPYNVWAITIIFHHPCHRQVTLSRAVSPRTPLRTNAPILYHNYLSLITATNWQNSAKPSGWYIVSSASICCAANVRTVQNVWDFRFSRQRLWRWKPSGILRHVDRGFKGAYCPHHQDDNGAISQKALIFHGNWLYSTQVRNVRRNGEQWKNLVKSRPEKRTHTIDRCTFCFWQGSEPPYLRPVTGPVQLSNFVYLNNEG
jgi:hypothetical protein